MHPLAHILDSWVLIFSSCTLFTVYTYPPNTADLDNICYRGRLHWVLFIILIPQIKVLAFEPKSASLGVIYYTCPPNKGIDLFAKMRFSTRLRCPLYVHFIFSIAIKLKALDK